MSTPKLSIVIPMLNESGNIPKLFARLFTVMAGIGLPWEALCIDDGSRDDTAKLVRSYQDQHPEVVLVSFARNFGQHAAVTAGFANARGDWVVTIDADLQNPPEEIPKLVEAFKQGHDLINTVRQGRQDTWFRKTASGIVNRIVRKISGIQLTDFGCMLRGYSREVAQAIAARREHKTFIPALATLFARSPVEIPVAHAARTVGESNYSLLKLLSLNLDLMTSFSVFPLRLLFLVGTALAMIGFAFGAMILGLRLYYGPGWANQGTLTVMGVLFIFTGLQFLAFGLLGEYIGRIFQQVRLREPYVIQSIERAGETATVPAANAGAAAPAVPHRAITGDVTGD